MFSLSLIEFKIDLIEFNVAQLVSCGRPQRQQQQPPRLHQQDEPPWDTQRLAQTGVATTAATRKRDAAVHPRQPVAAPQVRVPSPLHVLLSPAALLELRRAV